MRPEPDERPILLLRRAVAAFEERYLDLLTIYDEDLTPAVVFAELAELVSALADSDSDESGEAVLEECFSAVEAILCLADFDAEEIIGWSFFDQLPSSVLDHLSPYLGPHAEEFLRERELEAETGQLGRVGTAAQSPPWDRLVD
jgi:hypothetical protein